jgi:SAM-dependent methyltransferase
MTDPGVLFDGYASDYAATVQAAIGASGERVEYFAEIKAVLTARCLAGSPPAQVLDFGCGVGNTTRALGQQLSAATLTGFDLSHRSIEVAERLTAEEERSRFRFVAGDDGGLPWEDASFDAAFTSCVFHHITPADRPRWAAELARVLRPGGSLFVFEHNPFNPLTRRVVRDCPFDEGVELLRPAETVRHLAGAGLAPDRPWFFFFFPHALRGLRVIEPALRRVPLGAQYFVRARRSG